MEIICEMAIIRMDISVILVEEEKRVWVFAFNSLNSHK